MVSTYHRSSNHTSGTGSRADSICAAAVQFTSWRSWMKGSADIRIMRQAQRPNSPPVDDSGNSLQTAASDSVDLHGLPECNAGMPASRE
ncbi:hypothetical protein BDZ45DRAFT_669902 [Acephala macrosclerotiorum]|nr:hypothetical protein BDZ45DRAFT_669902 [Acephala macrosclerotiorum]